MNLYAQMTPEELQTTLRQLKEEHRGYVAKGLSLNMARGKPSAQQLDLSMPLLDAASAASDLHALDGTDCRNYGVMDGIPEAKELMAQIMDDVPERVCVFGNSSLNIMYDLITHGMLYGFLGNAPWKDAGTIKWICPVPGYDRHFAILEQMGIQMIPVPLNPDGPDMDQVEQLAADPAVKGIWCVPQYSNPSGITYSPEVVARLAAMGAADDFRIFWDNAYCVHHLSEESAQSVHVADIAEACAQAGHPHRYFKFASTSKITFPGAGIAAVAASCEAIAQIKKRVGIQTVGYDKINQLRHVRFLKDLEGVKDHMAKHAAIMKPKFDLVERKLSQGLGANLAPDAQGDQVFGLAGWTRPQGGYFVSFDGMPHTASRTVALAKEAGVVMTGAGATWPYKQDPLDSNIRIAPSLPPLEELDQALDVFVCCVKIAAIEALLEQ